VKRRAAWVDRLSTAGLLVVTVLMVGCAPAALDENPWPKEPAPAPASGAVSQLLRADMMRMMTRYGLRPLGAPVVETIELKPGSMFLDDAAYSSKRIGLDLAAHSGQTATMLTYTLAQRSSEGTISAVFLARHDRVVGAFLVAQGYLGGSSSLSDIGFHVRQ
jgi:hypothetical protein